MSFLFVKRQSSNLCVRVCVCIFFNTLTIQNGYVLTQISFSHDVYGAKVTITRCLGEYNNIINIIVHRLRCMEQFYANYIAYEFSLVLRNALKKRNLARAIRQKRRMGKKKTIATRQFLLLSRACATVITLRCMLREKSI